MRQQGKTRVYRVENDRSKGPYQGGACRRLQGRDVYSQRSGHPCPAKDGMGEFYYGSHRFGFASKDQARRWFDKDHRKALHKLGYKLAVYDVPVSRVQHGGHQVAFKRRERPTAKYSLLSL